MTINPNTSLDEMTDEIPLDSPTPAATETETETETATNNDIINEDNDDDEVNALLDDLHQPSEQEIALTNLKKSTSKLHSAILNVSSDIDTKLSISEKAKNVDANFGISNKASSTLSAVGSLFTKLQIRERAMDVANSETVRNIQYGVSDTLEKSGVNDLVVGGTQTLKNLDEEHQISTTTVDVLAGGMDWVAKSLNQVTGKSGDDDNGK